MSNRPEQQRVSRQLVSTEIPGARKLVPPRALGFGVAALAVAGWGALTSPEILAGYDALSWLLVLVPAYLLAYYRGWVGATRALAGGTLFVLIAELLAEHVVKIDVNWTLLLLVAVALLGLGLGLGVLAELLDRERRQALMLAYSDSFTGLPNRRLLDFVIAKEFAAARRGRPLSVALFELEDLVAYNERYGRSAGEEAIRAVALCLDHYTRRMNVTGHLNGSRWLSILSGESIDGAWVFADHVREEIGSHVLSTGEAVTASAGVTSYELWMRDPEELLGSAEQALRRAKDGGGNRVAYHTAARESAELPADFADFPTAEKRALEHAWRQLALEAAEIRYRTLFDGVPIGLYRSAPDGQIIDANPALVRMLGYPDRESLLAMDAAELYAEPEERLPWQSLLGREQTVVDYEVGLRRCDGSVIWARDSARAVLGRGGKVRYYQGALVDITERKRAEAELRAANEKLRAVIDAAPLAVLTLDPEGRATSWNPAAERIFGWRASEAIGRSVPLVAERQAEIDELRARVMRGELLAGVDLVRFKRDGRPVDVSLWAAPLFDPDGCVAGILALLADVTEQRQAEQQRVLLSTAVEQAADAIVITDTDGGIQWVNPAFERVTGYRRDEVLGRNPRLLASGRHEAAFYREMWETLTSGDVWTGQFINRRKDGTIYWQQGTISPVRDPMGDVVNYVSVARDVTRELELETQLRQAQKMEAIGQLAGGIAHDFNNLLTAILGNSEMLLSAPGITGLTRELAEETAEAGKRAASLTRQLLAFSRRQVLQPEVLDLNIVISGVTPMVRRLIGEHVALRESLDPELAFVSADRGQIEQVIVNLTVNARDAMPDGGTLTIETANVDLDDAYADMHAPAQPGRYVLLAISDTGVGMDEEVRSRIFEPFFTTKELGKGTGLGLATAFGIVKQSRGYIWVYSEPGQGTTFKVYLPRVEDPEALSAARPSEGGAGEAQLAGDETVLLVDDDHGVRAVGCRILSDYGYTSLEASGPKEALEIVERHRGPVHLVISDLVMPEMGGPELAKRLLVSRPAMRVLYMTGYTEKAVREPLASTRTKLLVKPFSRQALLRTVREALDAPHEGDNSS